MAGSRTERPLDVVVCQQSLDAVEARHDGLYSKSADLFYPLRNGLLFMGYDARDEDFVRQVIAEERQHQTTAEHIDRDLAFLQESATSVVDVVNYLTREEILRPGMRGLEIGAASGWPSWLFAEAGATMWLCELEPNSLASGLGFPHPSIGEGQRIVCDARYLPFADSTFDFVLCKEFAHHLEDKTGALAEANRVLSADGFLVFLEPMRSAISSIYELRHPDPHFAHSISWPRVYRRAIENAGFEIAVCADYHTRVGGRFAVMRHLRERSRRRLREGTTSRDPLSRAFMWFGGGSLFVFAKKRRHMSARPRPSIAVVDPAQETWTQGTSYDRSILFDELRRAGGGILRPVANAPSVGHA